MVAFSARESEPGSGLFRIGYSLMTPQSTSPDADASWTDFQELTFPQRIATAGRAVVAVDFGEEIPVADAPFQIVSDGDYLYVFRQSKDAGVYVDRFVLDEATGRLYNAWQVRFRRSGKADIPLDRRDTFGSTDMNGEKFVEPTIQLDFLPPVVNGSFAVALVPGELPSMSRWQFFLHNRDTGGLVGYSILRSANGLFDLADRIGEDGVIEPDQDFTLVSGSGAPLPVGHGPAALLYHQQEQLAQDGGAIALQKREARFMLAVTAGSGGQVAIVDLGVAKDATLAQGPDELTVAAAPKPVTALEISASCPVHADLPPVQINGPYTLELWAALTSAGTGLEPGIIVSSAPETGPLTIALVDGVPVYTAGADAAVTAADPIDLEVWTHLAATWDGTNAVLYVNGVPHDEPTDPVAPADPPAKGYRLGGKSSVTARIEQLRLWQRARTREEILAAMCTTVTSADPDWANLNGYWPMDAPAADARFTTVPNISRLSGADGTLSGTRWVPGSTLAASSLAPRSWDDRGLTIATGLLEFTTLAAAPWLTEGADSLVHLYGVAPPDGTMVAAHLSTVVARGAFQASWLAADPDDAENDEAGTVGFVARQTGAAVNPATSKNPPVTIAQDGKGHVAVTLRGSTGYTERWPKVPQELEALCQVLNGEAAQKGDVPAQEARSRPIYDYKAVVVTPAGGQLGPVPAPGTGSSLFAAIPDEGSSNGRPSLVTPTSAAPAVLGRAGTDPCWLPAPPPAGLDLSESGQFVEVLDEQQVGDYDGSLAADRDMAVEAWLRPGSDPSGDPMTVLVFNQPEGARYLLGIDGERRPYAVNGPIAARVDTPLTDGAWQHLAASYQSSFGIRLGGERYLDAGNDRSLDTPEALTAEVWVRLDEPPRPGQSQTAIARWAPRGGQSWDLGVDPDGKVRFSVQQSTATGPVRRSVVSRTALTPGTWHHLAGVYDVQFERQVAVMFTAGS
ncbi:LamG domain-containing protein [Actinocorallia longicatena]|uniref:LamG domain-containing protein n=1 Tax=Actinocorallia longicatena TaxID=111803 RepID=UPI0031CF94D9